MEKFRLTFSSALAGSNEPLEGGTVAQILSAARVRRSTASRLLAACGYGSVLWRKWRATVDEDGHYSFVMALWPWRYGRGAMTKRPNLRIAIPTSPCRPGNTTPERLAPTIMPLATSEWL